jgi:hypothetical protein
MLALYDHHRDPTKKKASPFHLTLHPQPTVTVRALVYLPALASRLSY